MEIIIGIVVVMQMLAMLFICTLIIKAVWADFKNLIWDSVKKHFRNWKRAP